MAEPRNETGATFAAIHDYCRVNNIPFSFTAVQEGWQNAPIWTASIIREPPLLALALRLGASKSSIPWMSVNNDDSRVYRSVGSSKRAALSAAAMKAILAEGINL
ncbi:hypothetical protein FRB94_002921 [Tulasnella sp. JGI-2019a]|nr:hypothetical protein FRB94_002921 [Tulasnella sp. JGI-2019a]